MGSDKKIFKVADLAVNESNPRHISEMSRRGLKESMKRFGYLGGIVYNEQTGKVVGGNQKLALLKELDVGEVEVRVVDISKIEEKALMLALNNPGIQGAFSSDVIEILEELKDESPDMYDEMRLFDITTEDEELDLDIPEPETEPTLELEMPLQPFEHYDYVVILSRTTQDWEWMQEFFDLKRVDASIGKAKKIGIGRGVEVTKLIEKVESWNTKWSHPLANVHI